MAMAMGLAYINHLRWKLRRAMSRRPESRQWLKMGVELEGGWTRSTRNSIASLVRGAVSKGDGSVNGVAGERGEITTPPFSLLDELCDAVKMMYPDSVNDSCGFHIHTSFTPVNTSLIASKEFFDFFLIRWETWAKEQEKAGHNLSNFWTRHAGQNQYCRRTFIPHEQLLDHAGDKYQQLNFNAYHRIKTVECRLLPMFPEVNVGVAAIRELSDIYDTFLNDHVPKLLISKEFEIAEKAVILHNSVKESPKTDPILARFDVAGVKELPTGDDVFYVVKNNFEDMILPKHPSSPARPPKETL